MKTFGFIPLTLLRFSLIAGLWLCPVSRAAEEVKASHILVKTQDEADLVRNEIMEKGGSRNAFMAAARKHSKDIVTKRAGGALGWFTRQKMVQEFSEAAFDMKTGEISEPVKSKFGYHLILCEDRREQGAGQRVSTSTPPQGSEEKGHEGHDHGGPPSKPGPHPTIPVAGPKDAGPKDLAPQPKPVSQAPASSTPPTPVTSVKPVTPPTETPKVQPIKPILPQKALKLTIDIKEKLRFPTNMVEVDLTLSNSGQEAMKVMAPELLPLGFSITGEVAPVAPPATWDELKSKRPEAPIVTLTSRRSLGGAFYLNDYFKDLPPNGRYRLVWKPETFEQNLKAVFPEISALPDMIAVIASLKERAVFQKEVAGLSRERAMRNIDKEVVFSVFEPITGAGGKKYFASIELDGQEERLWVELFADRQVMGVRQFANLALQGFYDGLMIFDIQKGNYLRTGCPKNNGTGGPDAMAPNVSNSAKIAHEKGTVSLVTRAARLGREAGSIFFICRKPHPEWDAEHIPVGKIVSGEEILDRAENLTRATIRKITVVTADFAPTNLVPAVAAGSTTPPAAPDATTPPTTPSADPKSPPPIRNPIVNFKTQKGEFTVELQEDAAPNTIANFVELAERGFFNPNPTTKKEQTFYFAAPGTVLIAGSPTNESDGGPGYRIRSETADNKLKHGKGTITMLLERDPATGNPVPDSAGSQFMLCLQDIPAWDGLYTPFGKVTEGLDVLDKLAQGDKIESVTVTQKRNRPYKAITLPLK